MLSNRRVCDSIVNTTQRRPKNTYHGVLRVVITEAHRQISNCTGHALHWHWLIVCEPVTLEKPNTKIERSTCTWETRTTSSWERRVRRRRSEGGGAWKVGSCVGTLMLLSNRHGLPEPQREHDQSLFWSQRSDHLIHILQTKWNNQFIKYTKKTAILIQPTVENITKIYSNMEITWRRRLFNTTEMNKCLQLSDFNRTYSDK